MAKPKMYPVIIDRSVVVELKDKPKITYPAGWRGEVNKATLKVIKDMEAGRELEGDGGVAPEADTSDAEIKAKHAAADAEIKAKHETADKTIAFAKGEALKQSKKMIADAEAKVAEINAAAVPDAGKAAG